MSDGPEEINVRFVKGLKGSLHENAIKIVHTDETLFKALKVLEGFCLGGQIGLDIVQEMLNQGLVFRELKVIGRDSESDRTRSDVQDILRVVPEEETT